MSATSLDLWIKSQTTRCLPALSLRFLQALNPIVSQIGRLESGLFYWKLANRRIETSFASNRLICKNVATERLSPYNLWVSNNEAQLCASVVYKERLMDALTLLDDEGRSNLR